MESLHFDYARSRNVQDLVHLLEARRVPEPVRDEEVLHGLQELHEAEEEDGGRHLFVARRPVDGPGGGEAQGREGRRGLLVPAHGACSRCAGVRGGCLLGLLRALPGRTRAC